jgi:hydrogenase nickel incorporation protein HypB
MSIVTIERKVLEKNDEIARQNRERFKRHGVFVINMVSSPGAGKTSILEQTLGTLRTAVHVAVIEGDVQTDLDAQRVSKFDIPAVQIVTRGGCHLEANLVQDALGAIDLQQIDLLIIENVGNLVCPANYDLGEDAKVVVASTTEGDDKPLKYPAMFRNASVLLINKLDLVPYVNARPEVLRANALAVNPHLQIFETSCVTRQGLDTWTGWLAAAAKEKRVKGRQGADGSGQVMGSNKQ